MRRLVLVLMAAAGIALAGCGGTQVRTEIGTVSSGLQIAAHDMAFDRSELQVPADAAFSLVFNNRDSVPHNVAVYADASASQPLFVGEIFGGPGSKTYHVPALKPGTYFFRCDVHQDMKGTLVAKL